MNDVKAYGILLLLAAIALQQRGHNHTKYYKIINETLSRKGDCTEEIPKWAIYRSCSASLATVLRCIVITMPNGRP